MDPASLRCDFLKPRRRPHHLRGFHLRDRQQAFPHPPPAKTERGEKARQRSTRVGPGSAARMCRARGFSAAHKDRRGRSQDRRSRRPRRRAVQKDRHASAGARFRNFSFPRRRTRSSSCGQIFDTSLYDLALSRIKSRVSDVTGAYAELKADYRSKTALLRFEEFIAFGEQPSQDVLAQMDALAQADEARQERLQQTVDDANAVYLAALETLNREAQHNADVRKWQQAEAELTALRTRQPQIAALGGRVRAADQCAQPCRQGNARC